MSISDIKSLLKDYLPSSDFPTYASSPESIRSEESISFPSSISDEVQFSEHPLENIVKVEKDEVETQDSSISKRKLRTAFTDKQLLCLEKLFVADKFLNRPKRIITAKKLGLSERQVKVWFQNRRMKDRRPCKKGGDGNNGKNNSCYDEKDIKKIINPLIAEEDVKFRGTNGSAGYGSTVHRHHHHHLPQNVELNSKTYDSYYSNESYDYDNSDTKVYNSDYYHYPTSNAINNIHNNYGYYSQPDDKYANYDYVNYYTTNEITASDFNLYTTRERQNSEQSCNSSIKSEPSFDSSDDNTKFYF
ncbi:homeobox protein DLX-4-like [Microplitis mediator]|uniref:homeobox protein DLX-4-like n=1 Tax=Microplitis mediator TaxID=375433 RepID=UPI002553598C|nr:homeobox protein DLX-4-like [Microplitis mediator]